MSFKRFPNDASTARDAKEKQEQKGEGKHRGPVAAQVPVRGFTTHLIIAFGFPWRPWRPLRLMVGSRGLAISTFSARPILHCRSLIADTNVRLIFYEREKNSMRGYLHSFRYAGAFALALLLIGLARAEDELKNPFAGDAAAAVEGKRLFLKTGCYSCHGHEAEGAVGPDLTDDEWIYKPTDSMIFNTISKGRSGTVMAPFSDQLKPEEIWKIVEFLRDKNRQRHANEQK